MTPLTAIMLLAAQLLSPSAFVQTRPAVELEGAIAKEQVDGDLKTAIASYQKISGNSSTPRDVRAKALLHLENCYEKLGQQQSRKVYEQIVREFPDQVTATQARTRLAALTQADRSAELRELTERKIKPLGRDLGPYPRRSHRR